MRKEEKTDRKSQSFKTIKFEIYVHWSLGLKKNKTLISSDPKYE